MTRWNLEILAKIQDRLIQQSWRLQIVEYFIFSNFLSGSLCMVYGASSVGKTTFVRKLAPSKNCISLSADDILRFLINSKKNGEISWEALLKDMYKILVSYLKLGHLVIFDVYSLETWFQFSAAENIMVETFYFFLYCQINTQVDRLISRNEKALALSDQTNIRRGLEPLLQTLSMFAPCSLADQRRVRITLSSEVFESNLLRLSAYNERRFTELDPDELEGELTETRGYYESGKFAEYEALRPRYPAHFVIDTGTYDLKPITFKTR